MSANQDNHEAENNLGIMLEEGCGTIQSYDQALYWYQRSANKGNIDALFNMGILHERGLGVVK